MVPLKSDLLTLMHFIVDSDPDYQEGSDFPKYDRRNQFGTWIKPSPETDCYNTRAKILIRDSIDPVGFAAKNPCRVETGHWFDVYTGQDFTQARDIQIDHVVPLKNAYLSGAWRWDDKERCHYANFIAYDSHLLAVSGTENMRKRDRTPAQYMPPDPKFACAYLQRWLNIKAVWDLTLDEDEADTIQALMESNHCAKRFQTVTAASLKRLKAQTARISEQCASKDSDKSAR
jgi:hypothetical protein